MARRGIIAELLHQARVAERERLKLAHLAACEHEAAIRRAQRAQEAESRARERQQKAAHRTAVESERAWRAEQKRREREDKARRVAGTEAEVAQKNAELQHTYSEIDGLLAATLSVDDHVDLETMRRVAEHPPFDDRGLETPAPPIPTIEFPEEPVYCEPEKPKGIFWRKRRHAAAIAVARNEHAELRAAWEAEVKALTDELNELEARRAESERVRLGELMRCRTQYDAECAAREREASEHNAALDSLIANLGYGTTEAIHEYIGIVLSNSVYPDHFTVTHDFRFDSTTAELRLEVSIPDPGSFPTAASYKYTRSSGAITEVALPKKACKDRYASAVHQVALRSLHEVFEADRRKLVWSISLQVGTETTDPATGKHGFRPFVAVAAQRDSFMEIDLSAVVPIATLEHLGATVSKNPYDLVMVDPSGVRQS